MLVSEMRATMAESIKNDSFEASEQDRAFRLAGNEFARRTRCTETIDTFDTVADTDAYDLTSEATDYKASRFLWAESSFKRLRHITYEKMAHWYDESIEGSGEPLYIATLNDELAYLAPSPDDAYTIRFCYWRALQIVNATTGELVTWTPGSDDASVTGARIDIADEYIDAVIRYGAIPVLTSPSPNILLRSGDWNRFQEFIDEVVGESGADEGVWLPNEEDYVD